MLTATSFAICHHTVGGRRAGCAKTDRVRDALAVDENGVGKPKWMGHDKTGVRENVHPALYEPLSSEFRVSGLFGTGEIRSQKAPGSPHATSSLWGYTQSQYFIYQKVKPFLTGRSPSIPPVHGSLTTHALPPQSSSVLPPKIFPRGIHLFRPPGKINIDGIQAYRFDYTAD